jgi:hypothetical protein
MQEEGLLPPREVFQWRVVPKQPRPAPEVGEMVFLTSHINWGLSYPPSDFFLEVLSYYKLQPHHLPPNSILSLAGFTALCEGFLGIRPRLDLFNYYFQVKKQTMEAKGALADCGSISIMIRLLISSKYPVISTND